MAKTIEQRAVEFKKRTINHANGIAWEEGYREGSHIGYCRGATEQYEIDNDKYNKLRELAYAIYTKAQYLSTDGSGLRKAMEDFYHYINYEEDK